MRIEIEPGERGLRQTRHVEAVLRRSSLRKEIRGSGSLGHKRNRVVTEGVRVGDIEDPDAGEHLALRVENREGGIHRLPHGRLPGLVETPPEFIAPVDDGREHPYLHDVGLAGKGPQRRDERGRIKFYRHRVGAAARYFSSARNADGAARIRRR